MPGLALDHNVMSKWWGAPRGAGPPMTPHPCAASKRRASSEAGRRGRLAGVGRSSGRLRGQRLHPVPASPHHEPSGVLRVAARAYMAGCSTQWAPARAAQQAHSMWEEGLWRSTIRAGCGWSHSLAGGREGASKACKKRRGEGRRKRWRSVREGRRQNLMPRLCAAHEAHEGRRQQNSSSGLTRVSPGVLLGTLAGQRRQ